MKEQVTKEGSNKFMLEKHFLIVDESDYYNKELESLFVMERLKGYQQDNQGNKNCALINQMNANLVDIEVRKEERLLECSRPITLILLRSMSIYTEEAV